MLSRRPSQLGKCRQREAPLFLSASDQQNSVETLVHVHEEGLSTLL